MMMNGKKLEKLDQADPKRYIRLLRRSAQDESFSDIIDVL
jgi:hypothetical protein